MPVGAFAIHEHKRAPDWGARVSFISLTNGSLQDCGPIPKSVLATLIQSGTQALVLRIEGALLDDRGLKPAAKDLNIHRTAPGCEFRADHGERD